MSVRSLSAAALAAAAVSLAAPSAEACDSCGYDYAPCPCVQPVVVVDPCCEPPKPSLRERIAAKRIARLERRQDRIAGRLADDLDPCCPPVAAPVYQSSYYQSSYSQTSYGHAGYGGPGYGGPGYGGGFGRAGYGGGYGSHGGYGYGY